MKTRMPVLIISLVLVAGAQAADPLPSWNDTGPKHGIVSFVEKVTKEGSPDFVPRLSLGVDVSKQLSIDKMHLLHDCHVQC
jgi:hypothetical protein